MPGHVSKNWNVQYYSFWHSFLKSLVKKYYVNVKFYVLNSEIQIRVNNKVINATIFLKNGDEESGNSLLWSYLNKDFKHYLCFSYNGETIFSQRN